MTYEDTVLGYARSLYPGCTCLVVALMGQQRGVLRMTPILFTGRSLQRKARHLYVKLTALVVANDPLC
jgi:hypothetical protein